MQVIPLSEKMALVLPGELGDMYIHRDPGSLLQQGKGRCCNRGLPQHTPGRCMGHRTGQQVQDQTDIEPVLEQVARFRKSCPAW